ncbi:MAG: hypothetical protein K2R98_15750 [Gemmataceae bacterium]|nr:hypothetical protein [Gemmataceae bacterium]
MHADRFHVTEYVDDYLHESVTPEYAQYLEEHCEHCTACQTALEEARRRMATLESLPALEASETLIRATMTRIDHVETTRVRRKRILAWSFLSGAAASILVLAGLHFYYWYMQPSPYDVVVFGQNQLYAAAHGSVRVRVMNHVTNQPMADVPVEIELRGKGSDQIARLASFTTNAQGTGQPRMELPDWPDGEYDMRIVARPGGTQEVMTQKIKLKRSWKLMLSTDKPVYKPGDEIRIRSLALRKPSLKPVAKQEAVFTVTDIKGNIVFKQKGETSAHGISFADCELANELIEGPYTIACKIGDTESRLTVEVKKYVLPKFEIEVSGLEPYYAPSQKVAGKVQANYFAGNTAVTDADVTIKVLTAHHTSDKPLQELKVQTNATGEAAFDFTLPASLPGREQDSGDARFALEVTVTDTAAQKQSKLVSRVVSTNVLRIDVIPEGGTLVPGVSNKIYLFASYPDGKPAAKARLKVLKIATGSTGSLPNAMPVSNEVPNSEVMKELDTNDLGLASFEWTPPWAAVPAPTRGGTVMSIDQPATPYLEGAVVTVHGTDAGGRTGAKRVVLTCGGHGLDFLIRTDKAVYDGGDTLRLLAMGGGDEPIFIDLIKDGQTILTQSISMDKGRGTYQFDLAPDVFGTIELSAYRMGQEGLPVRKSRVLYIRQAGQLKIEAKLDKKEYRPGRTAKLDLLLTDLDGKPAPGALSLAAVDKAVFAVLDQAPGMERTFYLLEQQLLEPVYSVYAWSPDFAKLRAEDRIELEQAAFSKTARSLDDTFTNGRAGNGGRRFVPMQGQLPSATDSTYSLNAASFPTKSQQTYATRDAGLKWVTVGWIAFAFAVLLAGYIALWMFVRTNVVVILHAVAAPATLFLLFMGAILITTTGKRSDMTFNSVAAGIEMRTMSLDESDMPTAQERMPPSATKPVPEDGAAGFKLESKNGDDAEPLRVREWFPETLLWKPELVTNDQGQVSIEVPLADSITDWRLSASAVTGDGRLGAMQSHIRVFQPFFVDLNLPVALTRNDEVAIPVVVHNHLNESQTVKVTLTKAPWFELLDDAEKEIRLPARKVLATHFRIRVTKVGKHPLEVLAEGTGVADAMKKDIEVIPDGRRIEQVSNGTLQQPVQVVLNVPDGAIEGSPKAFLKIYPSTFSQLVEGLDNIFRMPSGCFEQTSSTTYPNVLALDYLQRTGKDSPDAKARAKHYIHLGYQRLLSFEISSGGFDWFGRPPANRTLTAYGLMEFEDMAKVHNVDPRLIGRTRTWLLNQRNSDGSWKPESHGLHDDPTRGQGNSDLPRYSTTAYIGWAVFAGKPNDPRAVATLKYLTSVQPEKINDPYVLALVANALNALDATGNAAAPYLARLDSLKQSSDDGKFVWWQQDANSRTTFYGSGTSGQVETTALAALAMMHGTGYPGSTRGALAFIAKQKDGNGTWHSTQATVLALKALLAAASKQPSMDKERVIEVTFGRGQKQTIKIAADQDDVMKQIDLSAELQPGDNTLNVVETSGTGAGYQVAFRYHVPEGAPVKDEPIAISISYDKTELAVGDVMMATARVVSKQQAPMVILDLPIPAGFEIGADQLAELQGSGKIEKFQITARRATVYLRGLQPGKELVLRYDLRARMPVKLTVPAARAYEYYNPAMHGTGRTAQVTVTPRK